MMGYVLCSSDLCVGLMVVGCWVNCGVGRVGVQGGLFWGKLGLRVMM